MEKENKNPTLKKKISTTRKGYIVQQIVIDFLLKKNLRVYEPVVDDFHIDIIVERDKKYTPIQVKYHTSTCNNTSIQVHVEPTEAEWIVTPIHVDNKTHMIWYRNNRQDKRYVVSFAINTPKNNQKKKINFYKFFLKSPFDD